MNTEHPHLAALDWAWRRFDELTLRELEAIYMARQTVFAVEQACGYLDADGADAESHHLSAWAAGQRLPLAYARLVAPGVKYAEPSMGRVITLPAERGRGLGRELVRRLLILADVTYPGQGVRISAQAHLQPLYGDHGFAPVGDTYLEDGIPHIEMIRNGNYSGSSE